MKEIHFGISFVVINTIKPTARVQLWQGVKCVHHNNTANFESCEPLVGYFRRINVTAMSGEETSVAFLFALISTEPEEQSRNYRYKSSAVLLSTTWMTGGNWTVGVDGYRWGIARMRDSVESYDIWRRECEWEGKKKGWGGKEETWWKRAAKMEGGKNGRKSGYAQKEDE